MQYLFTKLLTFTAVTVTLTHAVDLRIGSGSMTTSMQVINLFEGSADMDTDILSLTEQHENLPLINERFYYFFRADLYRSETVDTFTDYASLPLQYTWPFIDQSISDMAEEYTTLPVPSDYRIRGFDFDVGIGYDLIRSPEGYVGIGLGTGLSMPFFEMRNYLESLTFTYDILQETETEIMTYKIGPTLQMGYHVNSYLHLYLSGAYGYQTGSMENDFVNSSMDVDGSYRMIDIGITCRLSGATRKWGWLTISPELFVVAGYTYSRWDIDETSMNLYDMLQINSFGTFTMTFESRYPYFGIGYNF